LAKCTVVYLISVQVAGTEELSVYLSPSLCGPLLHQSIADISK